jgi:mono/diheme cytochrome c family protein
MLSKQALGTRMAGLWVLLLLSALLLSISTFLLVATPSAHAQESGATAAPAGDVERGKEYFTGARRFANGGPPCMGCHSVGGIGALGGGALGPDLSRVPGKAVQAILSAKKLPPTMDPIFNPTTGRTPIKPDEVADIGAFITAANTAERPTSAVGTLLAISVVVAAVLVVLGHLMWRNRANGVRRPMVEERYQWTPWNPGGGPGGPGH